MAKRKRKADDPKPPRVKTVLNDTGTKKVPKKVLDREQADNAPDWTRQTKHQPQHRKGDS